jgi:endonuclease-3
MISNNNIGKILKIIEKQSTQWTLPSVSMIAQEPSSPFRVLIATLLSLRTKDEVTMAASRRLFRNADTPLTMIRLRTKQIEKMIYPVAFYRNKSRQILDICKDLINTHKGIVPKDLDSLLKFKGVGRKTANLVLILGYGIPAMCVDTHVHRISNRWGYINTRNPDESEQKLRQQLPQKYWMKYNDLLVTYGQNQCKPVSPLCSTCPIGPYCPKIGVTKYR